MQAQDLIRHLRIPEMDDLRQYVRSLPTNTLMGMGAFAAITTYWLTTRPKALKPPCDLDMQSVEVQVRVNMLPQKFYTAKPIWKSMVRLNDPGYSLSESGCV